MGKLDRLGVTAGLMLWGLLGVQFSEAGESEPVYDTVSTGTRAFEGGTFSINVLVEAANLGSAEVEVGEITFEPGYQGGGHRHGSIEIIYVLEGTMAHVVNGEPVHLTAGMVGIVRPSDTVQHRVVGDERVRAVVVWAPGGEADRLAKMFDNR